MASNASARSLGKQNTLSRVFSKFRKAPKSQDQVAPTPTSTQTSGHQVSERSTTLEGELGAAQNGRSTLQSQVPIIQVADHSKHHHGDTTYNTHGTTNFVGSVTNATFGPNSVTTIERATFVSPENAEASTEAALLWDTLPKQRDIRGPENEYLDGSREDVVEDTLGWFEDPISEPGFLIQGAAGLGKSTFARHLTHRLHSVGRLAASVSLSALPNGSRSPSSVMKIAARELGRIRPETIPAILEATKSCEAAPLVDQFETFLITPVRSLGLSHPLAVIFDAVDEYESHSALINALSSLPATTSSSIKFILLGRSNPRGRKDAAIRLYLLQPVSSATMERFLRKQLEGVQWEHGRRYATERITKLAELAKGLFIWVRVVCSLLQKRVSRFSPDHILESILDARRSLGDSEQLATLYHQAIVLLFPDSEDQDLFREYMTATLALQESLPMDEFSAYTDLPTRAIEGIQAELKALQIRKLGGVNDEGAQVHPAGSLFHLSFLEYLGSTSTPAHIAFHVSPFDSHSQLAKSCLRELPRFLPSSRLLRCIDLDPRGRYAVTYLTVHIHHGSPSVQPGSTEEWERSGHCATLRQTSVEMLEQWADLFVDLVGGASEVEACAGGNSDIQEDIDEPDAVERRDDHGGLGEHHPAERTELAWSNNFSGRDADHDTTDKGHASEVAGHDIRVAHVLHGVATALWDGRYTSRSSFQTSCLEVAVRHRPDGAEYWHDLGRTYATAAKWNGPEDLEQSIALHRNALAMRPPGHPRRAWSLNNLASALSDYMRERGSRTGEIDEVVGLQREALDSLPQGHKDTSMYLLSLAVKLKSRYEMTRSIVDLEEAIRLERESLALCPPSHANRASTLNELAWLLTMQYEAQCDTGLLEEAVCLGRESLSLCAIGHPQRFNVLDTLSTALTFVQDCLDEALQLSRESLSLTPLNHSCRWRALCGVASILLSRYERSGSAEDLEEAVLICGQASSLCPPKHFRRYKLLALQAKFGSPLPTLTHPLPMTRPFTTSKVTSERLCAQLGARRPCASHGLSAANARSSRRLPRQRSHPRLAPFVAPSTRLPRPPRFAIPSSLVVYPTLRIGGDEGDTQRDDRGREGARSVKGRGWDVLGGMRGDVECEGVMKNEPGDRTRRWAATSSLTHSRPRPRDKRVVLASTSLRRDILGSIGIDPEIVLFTFEENLSPGSSADTRVPGRMYEELVPNLAFGYGRNDTPTRSRACYAIPLGNPPIERNPRQPPDLVTVADTIVLTHPSPIASNGFSIGKKLGELYVWCSLDFANPSQLDKTFPIRIAPVYGMRRRRALQRVLWGALGKERKNDQTQLGTEQQLLEKQGTKEENLRMLLDMNGNVCEVTTGVTLIFPVLQSPSYKVSSIDERTLVYFADGEEKLVKSYVESGESAGRAVLGFEHDADGSAWYDRTRRAAGEEGRGRLEHCGGFPAESFYKLPEALEEEDEEFLEVKLGVAAGPAVRFLVLQFQGAKPLNDACSKTPQRSGRTSLCSKGTADPRGTPGCRALTPGLLHTYCIYPTGRPPEASSIDDPRLKFPYYVQWGSTLPYLREPTEGPQRDAVGRDLEAQWCLNLINHSGRGVFTGLGPVSIASNHKYHKPRIGYARATGHAFIGRYKGWGFGSLAMQDVTIKRDYCNADRMGATVSVSLLGLDRVGMSTVQMSV
ncbi:hypothetical protein FA13DRAFT_1872504 [Coprinellus micaceus]|uniref:Nephrocystin 3-like N-terminal domain-containing protein n=1 Tax=Coprinellus micaceus TaxID=71717 RepID=A0A4Y7S5Y3_COPMI|nr:hypothetical protein FA13DRAFT_1872504 [Coprinellus micaceus]